MEQAIRDAEWLTTIPEELGKYQGKWIAVWKCKIIEVTDSEPELLKQLKEKHPTLEPLGMGVPREGFIGCFSNAGRLQLASSADQAFWCDLQADGTGLAKTY